MEFNLDKAKEVVEKYGLSGKTIRVWQTRGAIPDKYTDPNFKIKDEKDNADKVILARLKELSETGYINFATVGALCGTTSMQLSDAFRGKGRIDKEVLNNIVKEVKRCKCLIINTFAVKSERKLLQLLENKSLKKTAILKDKSFLLKIERDLKTGTIGREDYMLVKDAYMKATILMNI